MQIVHAYIERFTYKFLTRTQWKQNYRNNIFRITRLYNYTPYKKLVYNVNALKIIKKNYKKKYEIYEIKVKNKIDFQISVAYK